MLSSISVLPDVLNISLCQAGILPISRLPHCEATLQNTYSLLLVSAFFSQQSLSLPCIFQSGTRPSHLAKGTMKDDHILVCECANEFWKFGGELIRRHPS